MKTRQLAWLALGAAVVVLLHTGSPKAAPAPAAPVEKWEYAEIVASSSILRGNFNRGGFGGRGGRGGGLPGAGGPGGGAAQPGVPVQPRVRVATIRWITAAGEVEATSWQELAEKLKLPPARSGVVTAAGHRLRVLNHLGGQGWEMVGGSGTAIWTFKRKLTK
jgi:hypothetical protein